MALNILLPTYVDKGVIEKINKQRSLTSMQSDEGQESSRYQFLGFYDEGQIEVQILSSTPNSDSVGRYQFLGFQ